MATVAQTQAFLSEAKAPSVAKPADVMSAVAAFVASGAQVGQQAAKLAQLLQAAEIAEPDEGLRRLMEEGFQKLGALQREAGEAEHALREVVGVLRQIQEWNTRFRAEAAALGYTV